jgi:hypothetical protein
MQAIRQLYEDAPTSISIPVFMHHKRLEVIFLVQKSPEDVNPDLKTLLAAMPNVGDNADFSRQNDFGRGDVAWDS